MGFFYSLSNSEFSAPPLLETPYLHVLKRTTQRSPRPFQEDLRFDSVVAVNPGRYHVKLFNEDGEKVASEELVALNKESYIVMRCGVEAQQGQAYPQDK